MTKQECAIIMAYTGICMLTGEEFNEYHKYIEYLMNRPVYTHELADKNIVDEIKEKSKEDFLDLCKEAVTDGWVKCEDRLPEEGELVLAYYEFEVKGITMGCYSLMKRKRIIKCNIENVVKVIAWCEFPRFEGEIQPEDELPFK
jgi:hypothetical protein